MLSFSSHDFYVFRMCLFGCLVQILADGASFVSHSLSSSSSLGKSFLVTKANNNYDSSNRYVVSAMKYNPLMMPDEVRYNGISDLIASAFVSFYQYIIIFIFSMLNDIGSKPLDLKAKYISSMLQHIHMY